MSYAVASVDALRKYTFKRAPNYYPLPFTFWLGMFWPTVGSSLMLTSKGRSLNSSQCLPELQLHLKSVPLSMSKQSPPFWHGLSPSKSPIKFRRSSNKLTIARVNTLGTVLALPPERTLALVTTGRWDEDAVVFTRLFLMTQIVNATRVLILAIQFTRWADAR